MLEAILIVIQTLLTAFLIYKLTTLQRSLPDIQEVLDDVGASIGEQLSSVLEKPMVKRSMSVLGKESGKVRANDALKNRVADKIMSQRPFIKRVMEEFEISPIEGLQLLNDPDIGPFLQRGISVFTKNLGGPQKSGPRSNNPYG